jgi:hypothetical protein
MPHTFRKLAHVVRASRRMGAAEARFRAASCFETHRSAP